MAKKENEVAVVEEQQNALVVAADMYGEDEGGGFEGADQESYAIPFLSILQSGSPQVKKSDGAYIKGAEEGDFFNSVTGQVFKEGITVVPCNYKRVFIKWAPRDAGGGFLGEFKPESDEVFNAQRDAEGKLISRDGNLLVETRVHYVLLISEDGTPMPAVISMASTQARKSKQWMTMMQMLKLKRADGSMFTPPMYSHKFSITSVPEQNDQGSWFGWKIENAGMVTDANIVTAAREFKKQVQEGKAQEKPQGQGIAEEEIPF